jgi:type I site-specific restriction endonuclease
MLQEDYNMELDTQKSLAIAELNPIVHDIAAFGDTIEAIDITSEEELADVGDLVKMLNGRRRKIEDKRTSLVAPLNKVVKDINELFKAPRDRIDQIVQAAKKHMNNFARAQQAIADAKARREREEAQKERDEAARLAESMKKMSGDAGEETAAVVVEQAEKRVEKAAAPAKVAVSRGRESAVSVQKTWAAQVTDIRKLALAVAEGRLPVTMIEPNMRALVAAARAGGVEKEVDGVRYFQKVSTVVR